MAFFVDYLHGDAGSNARRIWAGGRGWAARPSAGARVYYLRRTPPDPGLAGRFEAKFKHPPVLNADLGYYAVYMAQAALETRDPLAALRAGSVVQGKELRFDKNQVASGTAQEVYAVGDGGVVGRVEAEVANRSGEIPPG